MDIQGANSGPNSARKAYEQRQNALIDANRAMVRAARDVLTTDTAQRLSETRQADEHVEPRAESDRSSSRDAIELSAAAQASSQATTAEREAHVRELAEEHRAGRLNSEQRIERAAQSLLGD